MLASLLKIFIKLSSYHVLLEQFDFHNKEGDNLRETQKTYVYDVLRICDNFKYELRKSYESCSLKEWKNKRDKRLAKDECDVFLFSIGLLGRQMYLTCLLFVFI